MICSNCGKPVETGSIYCPHCGAPVTSPDFSEPVAAPSPAPVLPATQTKPSKRVILLLACIALVVAVLAAAAAVGALAAGGTLSSVIATPEFIIKYFLPVVLGVLFVVLCALLGKIPSALICIPGALGLYGSFIYLRYFSELPVSSPSDGFAVSFVLPILYLVFLIFFVIGMNTRTLAFKVLACVFAGLHQGAILLVYLGEYGILSSELPTERGLLAFLGDTAAFVTVATGLLTTAALAVALFRFGKRMSNR